MPTAREALKMICYNESCINKSIVYRKYDVMKDAPVCKSCGVALSRYKPTLFIRQDLKAKQQLKEMGSDRV
jgi:hypothetical protein